MTERLTLRLTSYWLVFVILWAPLPIGSNRPWSAGLLSALGLAAFLGVLWGRGAASLRARDVGWAGWLLVIWAALPVLQIVPFSSQMLSWVSQVSSQAYQLAGVESTAPISLDRAATVTALLLQLSWVAVFLTVRCIAREKSGENRLWTALLLAGGFNAAYALINLMTNDALRYFEPAATGFATGTYINKNHFAALLELVFPLAVVWLLQGIHQTRRLTTKAAVLDIVFANVWRLLLALAMLLALVLSGSRGGVLAVMAGLICALLLFRGQLAPVFPARHLALGALVLGLLVAVLAGDRVLGLYQSRELSGLRLPLWRETLAAIPGVLPFGAGAGAYEWWFAPHKTAALGIYRFDHAHNDYLELLSTQGVLGLALYLGGLAVVFQAWLSRRRRGGPMRMSPLKRFGLLWALLAFLFHGLVDFNLQIPANAMLFFTVLAMFSAGAGGARRERSRHA